MKKASGKQPDEMRPEYDFASMKGRIRGKYAASYKKGTNIVLLEPEVAEAFPNDEAVNRALRAVLSIRAAIMGKPPRP